MLKKTLAVFAALMVVLPAIAGGKKDVSAMERIKADGKIILGTSADYPPYEFHALIDGKDTIVGFDIEIAKEIAKDLGVELEIKDMSFDGLLADVMIGAQKGAIQVGIAKEQIKGVTGADLDNNHPQIKELGTLPDLIMEVKNNKIEAVIAELPVAEAYVKANPDLAIASYTFEDTEGGSAIAVKKGNTDLVAAMNATISRLAAENKISQFVGEASLLADAQ